MDNLQKSPNITNFFESPVKLISDPEGFSIYDASKNNNSSITNNKILVLGDLLDSTGILDNDISKKDKAYNIRNLMKVINNPEQIKVLLGNRDLNKIKCRPLIEVNNTKIWKQNSLEKIVSALKVEVGKKKWKIPSLKHWLPWWNIENKTDNKKTPIIKNFVKPDNSCLDRFNKIFGVDPKVGTMSAQNLLETIPIECKELSLITEIPEDDETKAAIVLVVFYLMLDKTETNTDTNNGVATTNNIDLKIIRGLLTKFYNAKNTYYCAYATLNDKLCLFSHGGMTHKFFDKNIYKEYINHINHNAIIYTNTEDFKGKSDYFSRLFGKKGGFFKGDIVKNVDSQNIIIKINAFNGYCKHTMKTVLNNGYLDKNNDNLPSVDILFLLLIGVPRTTTPDWDLNPDQVGPIQPGLAGMRKNGFVCSDKKLIQFIGHLPNGYSSTLDVYQGQGQEQYVINLDISQSVLSQKYTIEKISKSNYLYLTMDNNLNVYINQNVSLQKNKFAEFNNKIELKNTLLLKKGDLDSQITDKIKAHQNNIKTAKQTSNFHFKIDNKLVFTRIEGFNVSPNIVPIDTQGGYRTKKGKRTQPRNTKRKKLTTSKSKKKRNNTKSRRRKK